MRLSLFRTKTMFIVAIKCVPFVNIPVLITTQRCLLARSKVVATLSVSSLESVRAMEVFTVVLEKCRLSFCFAVAFRPFT